jgi:hypothetical protein
LHRPELDYTKVDEVLIKNLLDTGIIHPHELRLGIKALPNGTVVSNDAIDQDIFYTIGSTMRGFFGKLLRRRKSDYKLNNLHSCS